MPLQDLTPELRTRLSAVERTVGWFVTLATIALVGGFFYYLYQSGKNKGWFITKINYATGVNDASGIHVGDPVTMMGFKAGEITGIRPNDPFARYGVTVNFWVDSQYAGYIWLDSRVRVNQNLILGSTTLEILKGRTGAATAYYDKATGQWMALHSHVAWSEFKDLSVTNHIDLVESSNILKGLIESNKATYYATLHDGEFERPPDDRKQNWVYLITEDAPSLSDRLDKVAQTVEHALPNILDLTNKLDDVLTNAAAAVVRVDHTLADLHPALSNLDLITANLTNNNGSLGAWLISTNLAPQVHDALAKADATLTAAHDTLDNADTNLTMLATNVDETLIHLADITSNLAWQVRGNTNLVGSLGKTIIDADDLMQGLKREWFLRSAFKKKAEKKK